MRKSFGLSNKQLGLALICIIGAVILLTAALFEPKRATAEEWIPLNEAVEEALIKLDKQNENIFLNEKPNQNSTNTSSAASELMDAEPHQPTEASESVIVPDQIVETAPLAEVPAAIPQDDGRIDVNRASAAELVTLKGIGPAKAQAIIKEREDNGKFKSIDDLLRVKGIGKKTLSSIKDSIVARP
ncbi:competence protein ComEA [Paenibacillus castaneae]|uniref:ComEA family DNA-binding protein n=1 Tax=Paenibacillus castaneae TaxID=474957 RepID=UPI000C99FFC2|nr:ComEA family DNA-binding protein [Paenibacillus castaneae]NIK77357.1 competence protein ComEA [Paenibacillus castaneae]